MLGRALDWCTRLSLVVFCSGDCIMIDMTSSPASHHSPLCRFIHRWDELNRPMRLMGTGHMPELGNSVVALIVAWRFLSASIDQILYRLPSAYNKAFTAQQEARTSNGLVAVNNERASLTRCAARHFIVHSSVTMCPYICFMYAVLLLFNKLWEATAVAPQVVYNTVADIAQGLQ